MRVFKYRAFRQWAKFEKLNDSSLKNAVEEMDKGLFDANLGGGLYKKRVAKAGKGKRGGYRTILAFKQNDRAFFMYGFAKNERDNINIKEEMIYKRLAKFYLEMPDQKIGLLIEKGELYEVRYEDSKKSKKTKRSRSGA